MRDASVWRLELHSPLEYASPKVTIKALVGCQISCTTRKRGSYIGTGANRKKGSYELHGHAEREGLRNWCCTKGGSWELIHLNFFLSTWSSDTNGGLRNGHNQIKGGVLGTDPTRKMGLLGAGQDKKGEHLPRHIPVLDIYVSAPPPPGIQVLIKNVRISICNPREFLLHHTIKVLNYVLVSRFLAGLEYVLKWWLRPGSSAAVVGPDLPGSALEVVQQWWVRTSLAPPWK